MPHLRHNTDSYECCSRWSSPGQWVVHAVETYALAVLENLVHWQTATLPPKLVCVAVDIPDTLNQEELDRIEVSSLALNDYEDCRSVGDDWYDRGETAVLWVPSVVSPHESNLLFNQQHKDFSRIVVHKAVRLPPSYGRTPRCPRPQSHLPGPVLTNNRGHLSRSYRLTLERLTAQFRLREVSLPSAHFRLPDR